MRIAVPQARARDAHAAEDRNNVRPKYPLMATGTNEEESVVVEVGGVLHFVNNRCWSGPSANLKTAAP